MKRPVARSMMVAAVAATITLFLAGGCEQPPAPGETYHKKVVLWPIVDNERWEGVEDGQRWMKEKGDAVLLAYWDKEKRYDSKGDLTYRCESSLFFPLYSTKVEETQEYIEKEGSVLLWPYKSRQDKELERLD